MNQLDPVCGKRLRPADAVASAPYEAILYHFCSQECHGRFRGNPALYLGSESREENLTPVLSSNPRRVTPLPWHLTE